MRVLLGNPPWTKKGFYWVRAGSRWPHFEPEGANYFPFPFFMAHAAALLKREGFKVALLDGVAERLTLEQFCRRVEDFKPDLVLLENSTPSLEYDLQVAETLKKSLGAKIAMAGLHTAQTGEDFLRTHSNVDYLLDGEYEITLLELTQHLAGRQELAGIPGLRYRDNSGEPKINPSRPLLESLDELPWPARELTPVYAYNDYVAGLPTPSLQMWASRGCPFRCIFCAWPQLVYRGHRYRSRNPVDVVDEMQYCVKRWGFKSVYFDDDTFNIGKSRIITLCEEKIRRGIRVPWGAMARADTSDKETLEKMAEANLYSIKYGVESGVQPLVDKAQKNLDLRKVREMVKFTKELGVKVHLTFTFGLPGETKETIKQTMDFAFELDPESIQFSVTTPYPGTQFFEEMKEEGNLVTEHWAEYDGAGKSVIRTEYLSARDLEEAVTKARKAWGRHVFWRQIQRRGLGLVTSGIRHPMSSYDKTRRLLVGS